MWALFTLFFINLSFWIILFLSNGSFSSFSLVIGIILSFVISYATLKLKLISKKNDYLFLQFGFYKFIFSKINNAFYYNIKFAYKILTNKTKDFSPLVDYIYSEDNDVYETCLLVNTLNMLPGVICIAIKKGYFAIYSLGYEYFIPSDIFLFSQEILHVYDDSLI